MSDEKKLTGYPSIDKPWLKYYTEEDLKIEAPECTIYQNIYDKNKDYNQEERKFKLKDFGLMIVIMLGFIAIAAILVNFVLL